METKTKDMKLFHILVRNNRKKGTDTITELSANGNDYKEEERIVFLKCLFAFFFSCKCRFSTSDGFPLSLQILYFDLEFEIAVLITTSDHHPIKLSIYFEYSLQPMRQKDNKPGITKGKMGKIRQGMVRASYNYCMGVPILLI
jgi:hypothetical protein